MSSAVRSNPHLRLTAAILVAVLAALAGSLESEGAARARRGESATLVGGLRLVSVPSGATHALLGVAAPCRRESFERSASAPTGAAARALARCRFDASRATGAPLLRTTALPPPIA